MIEELSEGQQEALYAEPGRPMLVTGPARSGKSFVLALRAAWLIRHRLLQGKKLLFLAEGAWSMEMSTGWLGQLLSVEEQDEVDVMPFNELFLDAWMRISPDTEEQGLTGVLHRPRFYVGNLDEFHNTGKHYIYQHADFTFYHAFRKSPRIGGLSERAARREFTDILMEWNIRTLDDYLAQPRPALFGTLSDEDKVELWKRVFGPALKTMAERETRRTSRDCAAELNLLTELVLNKGGKANKDADLWRGRYGAVIVDDAQNLSPSALRFLKALAADGNLVLASNRLETLSLPAATLEECGIDVRGRVFRMDRSYSKASGALQTYARNLLEGQTFTEIDGTPAALPAPVALSGTLPQERTFTDRNAMLDAIAAWLKEGQTPRQGFGACIVTRLEAAQLNLIQGLGTRGIPCVPNRAGDWVMPLYTQGFEFHTVTGAHIANMVIVLDDWLKAQWDDSQNEDPAALRARAQWALQALYATITRAENRVLIVSSNGLTVDKLREEARGRQV